MVSFRFNPLDAIKSSSKVFVENRSKVTSVLMTLVFSLVTPVNCHLLTPIRSRSLLKRSRVDSKMISVNGNSTPPVISIGPDSQKTHHRSTQDPRQVGQSRRSTLDNTLTVGAFLGAGGSVYYIFIEASTPQKNGDRAGLISPVITRPKQGACFQFYYHM